MELDVFNALNLISEDLGKCYEDHGYNPFGDEFQLDANYVSKLLEKAKNRKHLDIEPFLEEGNKKVKENFKTALENTEALKLDILEQIESATPELKESLQDVLLFLKNRAELLTVAIEKLKSQDADSLRLYEDIYNIDAMYSEILKESYFKEFKKQVAIENFLSTCRIKAKLETFKQEQIKEQEKIAKQKLESYKFEEETKEEVKDQKKSTKKTLVSSKSSEIEIER